MPVKNRTLIKVSFLIALIFLMCHTMWAMERPVIGIFLSSKIRPYLEALRGLKKGLHYEYQVFDLEENFELARHYVTSMNFQVAVAIGPEATRLLYREGKEIPKKLAIMTLDIEKLVGKQGICGIDLRIPIGYQLQVIREKIGPNKRIAILYNKKENQDIIQDALTAAKGLGLVLIPLAVKDSAQIMERLSPVLPSLDLILFIPDSVVISEKIVTHITKQALLKGVAVCGFNRFFYEIGALLSFIINYEEVGEEAAVLLTKLIRFNQCLLARPTVRIKWNEKAAQILIKTAPKKWAYIKGKGQRDKQNESF